MALLNCSYIYRTHTIVISTHSLRGKTDDGLKGQLVIRGVGDFTKSRSWPSDSV
jgi:hypothetical protein